MLIKLKKILKNIQIKMKIKTRNKSFKLNRKKNYKEYIKININANINFKYNIFVIICLILLIYQIHLSKEVKIHNYRKLNRASEISMKIYGTGTQQLINQNFYNKYKPSELFINGNQKTVSNYATNLRANTNDIIYKWTVTIKSCESMFSGVNLLSIDLSKFQSSQVNSMTKMFYQCTMLTSVNFNNFDTSLATDISYLFYDCSSLKTLDLSNFNTKSLKTMKSAFNACRSLPSINLDNFDTSGVTEIDGLFSNCNSLREVSLNNFNTSLVKNFSYIFFECNSLGSIDLSSFNTSKANNMEHMFHNCNSLRFLDISSFKTPLVTNMNSMFYDCNCLFLINISHFDTSSLKDMSNMFTNCFSLKSLYLTKLKTSSVTNMSSMFENCYSLYDLDLLDFITSSVTDMNKMFSKCYHLTTLNLSSFDTSHVSNMTNMFDDCNITIYCIINRDINLRTNLLSKLIDSSFENNNCTELCFLKNGKYIFEKEICLSHCYDDDTYKFEYENICYITCPKGTRNSTEIEYLCVKEEPINISTSLIEYISTTELISDIFSTYIKSYSTIINNLEETNKPSTYIHTSDEPNKTSTYIYTSDEPNKPSTYIHASNEPNKPSTYIYTSDEPNKPSNYINNLDGSNEPPSTNIYISDDSLIIDINYFKKLCKINDNITTKDDIIRRIREELNNEKLSQLINLIVENLKDDLLADENDIIYQITSTYNQRTKEYTNISIINLGECESLLRSHHNISNDTTLLIFKIDVKEEGLLIPIVEYEVYNSKTKEKLNLDICKDIKIDISIPVNIDENNLFKYNLSSDYYNDLCYPYTTEFQTDITLTDRKEEFNEKNMSLCENNCEYQDYDFETKKVTCECFIKIDFLLISEISINKNKLIQKFFDFKKTTNICIVKCYKKVFCKEGIIDNIGSYIILTIIVITIILAIIFRLKGFAIFKKKIIKIMTNLNQNIIQKQKTINNKLNNNVINKKKLINNLQKIKQTKKLINKLDSKKNILKKNKKDKKNPPIRRENSSSKITLRNKKNKFEKDQSCDKLKKSNILINIQKNQNVNIAVYNTIKQKDKKNIDNMKYMIYNDYELNNLSYNEAFKKDKRTYMQYYVSLLRMKHLLIFTFITYTDYNSKIIKISLFLFLFTSYYAVNALFFTDSTIHEIYEDKGSFNFIYQIPQILYSSLISVIINTAVKSLSLSEKNILMIKRKKYNTKEIKKLFKYLIKKFILYYIISLLFLIIFWYYIACFGVIFKNSQIHLIKDTLISFTLSLLYPFGINFIPGIPRMISLNGNKKNRKCLYKISQIIQII